MTKIFGLNPVGPTCREHERRCQLPRHLRDVVRVLGLSGALRFPLQLLDRLPDGILRRVGAVRLLSPRDVPLEVGAAAPQPRAQAIPGGREDELVEEGLAEVVPVLDGGLDRVGAGVNLVLEVFERLLEDCRGEVDAETSLQFF